MGENENLAQVVYQCVQCKREITSEQLPAMIGIKCPNCGFRVLRKVRPPVVKKVKAR